MYYNYDGDATYNESGVDGVIRYDYEDKVTSPQTENNLGNRLESVIHDIDNDGISDLSYAYAYDAAGNCQTKVIDASETHSYLYDNIYQLTEDSTTGGDKLNWLYDAVSNWDYVNLNDSLHKQFDIAAGNSLNQYTTVDSASFTYDDNGNLTSDGAYTYSYDAENRLLAVKQSGTPVVSYDYDALGRRVSKMVGAATTRYCYDGDQVVAEYDGSGTLLRKFIYGPGIDEPICMIVPGSPTMTYFYHQDALGSVVALSKYNTSLGYAEIVERYKYSAFGETTICDGSGTPRSPNQSAFDNPYMFTGREYETLDSNNLKLYYYRARFYNPQIGRFLQTDPIGYSDSMNLYAYVGNNPTIYRDPSGLTALSNIGGSERIDVVMEVGPLDAITVYQYSKLAVTGAKSMTDTIIADSQISVSSTERSNIQNAVLHGLVSAYFYRNLNKDNAEGVLNVHEIYNGGQMLDSLVDQKNNTIGRGIGLGAGDIYAEVMESYYRGEFYGLNEMGVVGNIQSLPIHVRDLATELESINNELGRLLDSFNNYYANRKNCP